jgi:acetyl-CoA C-acetyltransferase
MQAATKADCRRQNFMAAALLHKPRICLWQQEQQPGSAGDRWRSPGASHQETAMRILIAEDEEFKNVVFDKIPSLKPVFDPNGTVTAANASTMNDGASALVLVSKEVVEKYGLKPIAKIRGYADAATDPLWFTTAPALAIPKALTHAGVTAAEVSYYEINEAFAAVALANQRELNLDNDRLNVFGGAVALGHPLGASGARIISTLISVLHKKGGDIGVAGICNGGGGASAIVIEKV